MLRGDSGARLEVGKTSWQWCVPEIIQPRAVAVRDQGSDDGQGEELLKFRVYFWTSIGAGFLFENICTRLCILVLVSPGLRCPYGQLSLLAGGFSGCRAWALSHGFSGCSSRAPEHRLSGRGARLLRGMWAPPPPGIEPASPASASRFLSAVPPGKPRGLILLMDWLWDVRERTENGPVVLGPVTSVRPHCGNHAS